MSRPPESNVRIVLSNLECRKTEDSDGDEPYMWVLGFKVDASNLTLANLAPQVTSVDIFTGGGSFRNLVGRGTVHSPQLISIPAAVGERTFTVRPWRLPIARTNTDPSGPELTYGWFPGLAGSIALLFDEDNYSAETAAAGNHGFQTGFREALRDALNGFLAGQFDNALAVDANGDPVPIPSNLSQVDQIGWRFAQVRIPRAREAMTEALKGSMKARIRESITAWITFEIISTWSFDEALDKDDSLGDGLAIFLTDELLGLPRPFRWEYTDDESHYVLNGFATANPTHRFSLQSYVTNVERELAATDLVSVTTLCEPARQFREYAYRQKVTTRFELKMFSPEPVQQAMWFLDGKRLAGTAGTVPVNYRPVSEFEAGPERNLAGGFPGGRGILQYRISGPVLEIWNEPANGVFVGNVTCLCGFPGDPELVEKDYLDSGYSRSAELMVQAVDLTMEDDYYQAVGRCIKDLRNRRMHTREPVLRPGEPPPLLDSFRRMIREEGRVLEAVGMRVNQSAEKIAANNVNNLRSLRSSRPRQSNTKQK